MSAPELSLVRNRRRTFQEDIAVNYVVQNKSSRNVYLVTGQPSWRLRFKDSFVGELMDAVKGPDHEQYDYDLIPILPGKSYRGNLLIKARERMANGKYNFETVTIQAGFSYLFDVSNP